MKQLKTIVVVVMAIFVSHTSAIAQDIETRVSLEFTVNANNWKKILHSGEPVTIFAYKQEAGIYSFGLYSDDYAGIIDMKINPFDIQPKELKKLPKTKSKKIQEKLNLYYNKALTKAREKALAGKYKIIAPDAMDGVYSHNLNTTSIRKKDTITIYGYKETRDYVGTTYHYAIIKDGSAGIYIVDDFSDKTITLYQVPLSFLPSTDDPQVKAIIDKEKSRIVAERQEEERRLAEQRRADEQLRRTQEHEYLKLMDPAYIVVKKMKMDSAGGIEVSIQFTNCSSRRVKYVYFTGYFLNAVGDKCRNEIGGSTVWKYTGVGPVSRIPDTPNNYGSHIKSFHSDPPFYSKIARKLILSSVTIEYMDGQKTVLSGSELEDRVDYDYDYSWFL